MTLHDSSTGHLLACTLLQNREHRVALLARCQALHRVSTPLDACNYAVRKALKRNASAQKTSKLGMRHDSVHAGAEVC